MDDLHIISGVDTEEPKGNPKRLVGVLLMLIVITSIGTGTYYFGRKSVQGVQTESEPAIEVQKEKASSLSNEIPELTGVVEEIPSQLSNDNPSNSFSKTTIVNAIPGKSGFITESGLVGIRTNIQAGNDGTSQNRGFVTFDLSALPQGVVVGKAIIRIYQTQVVGNPFGNFGVLKIDHGDFGDSLDADDYNLTSVTQSFTIPQTTTSAWEEIDVTNALKKDLVTARTLSQYRIYFANEKTSAGKEQMVYFQEASSTENVNTAPQLVVNF